MKKVRIGLLVDDFTIPFWAYKMIERIISSDYAEVVLVVKKKHFPLPKRSLTTRIKDINRNIYYKYYKKWETKKYTQDPNAFESKNLKNLVDLPDIIEVECIEKKFSDYVQENDLRKIAEYNVDVFIRLGFRILRGGILKSARVGVWSYHHGDNLVNRGGPAGFWEYFQKEREVGSILQILTEDLDAGEVLYRSWSAVQHSHVETLNSFYWKTSLFLPRKVKELYGMGEERFLEKLKAENTDLHFYSNQLYTLSDNSLFLKLLAGRVWDRIKFKVWTKFNFEQWILLYAFNKKDSLSTSIFRYKRITPAKDRFWADPFVVAENGRFFIFFEEYINKAKKGHISVIEIDKKGKISEPKEILNKEYHLSYPFVFRYESDYYMIPESAKSRSIQLYKAKSFPYDWEFQMNLMENVEAVDTTIFTKDNKVWLFTNIKEIAGSSFDELFLFSSDSLFSKVWKSHPKNPIVSDVKSARSAGKLFYHNDRLYRPSQDCSYRYGYSTVINEVLLLDDDDYKETRASNIYPKWDRDVLGTHTFSFDAELSVIDAVIKRKK